MIAADLDEDGWLDLYVANDSVENRFWSGRGDGTFVDATLLSGTGVNGLGLTEAGMGLAVATRPTRTNRRSRRLPTTLHRCSTSTAHRAIDRGSPRRST